MAENFRPAKLYFFLIPRNKNFILGSFSVVDVDILMCRNIFVLSVIW